MRGKGLDPDWRQQVLTAACWVEDFLRPGYGPGGGHKLFDGEEPVLLRSAASALREVPLDDASTRPFRVLVTDVQRYGGDQAAAAGLLAAGLVRRALESDLPVAAFLEGYGLARRQALGVLAAAAHPADAADALAGVAPSLRDHVPAIMEGLMALAEEGTLDLDHIDLRIEGDDACWLEGVVAECQEGPRRDHADAGVLLVDEAWRFKPRAEGVTQRIQDPAALGAPDPEDTLRRDAMRHLQRLGVGLLVCRKGLDEGFALDAARAGIHTWHDAPKDAVLRLQQATGATPVDHIMDATGEDVGGADLAVRPRRMGGVLVSGPGLPATLALPTLPGVGAATVQDDGERLLRAAGAFLADPRAVPGGGRWQRDMARSLRRAADAAPGKSPFALHAAARCLDGLADTIVRSLDMDPLTTPLPPGADTTLDPYPAVQLAVDTAFTTAVQVLRIDDRFDKTPSTPEALRGGTGPIGSPKGMPGDVPPLM